MTRSIGYVHRQQDGTFIGEITFIGFKLAVEMRPNADKRTEKAPDFRIFEAGNLTNEIGAGWHGPQREGRDYRSISCMIDDPTLHEPLRFNTGRMAGQDDDDVFALLWSRRDQSAA